MPSPLPGMNPFLEQPELWSEFHSRMIVAIADALSETLSDDYRIAIQHIQKRYLEIQAVITGQVITVIELLSPKNKRSGEGRNAYLHKRQQILMSQTQTLPRRLPLAHRSPLP